MQAVLPRPRILPGPRRPPLPVVSRPTTDSSLLAQKGVWKKKKNPELVRARRCRLVLVGVEVGGRFGAEAANWLRLLAGQRASDVQAAMRAAARAAWVARWSGLLAVAAQRAVAASLLELPLAGECNVAGEAPELHEVLADVRWQLPTIGSRQGPR